MVTCKVYHIPEYYVKISLIFESFFMVNDIPFIYNVFSWNIIPPLKSTRKSSKFIPLKFSLDIISNEYCYNCCNYNNICRFFKSLRTILFNSFLKVPTQNLSGIPIFENLNKALEMKLYLVLNLPLFL